MVCWFSWKAKETNGAKSASVQNAEHKKALIFLRIARFDGFNGIAIFFCIKNTKF